MKQVRLKDVAEVNPRVAAELKSLPDQEIAFLPMDAIGEDGSVRYQERRRAASVLTGYTLFKRGDVLLAKITPCMENGKAAFLNDLATEHGAGSTEFHVLRPGPDLDGRFLFYLIWNPAFRFKAQKRMTGSGGQKRVPADFLKDLVFNCPPLAEQRRIAAILDKADAIRRKRQQVLALADDFLRAAFLDMFGNCFSNPKGWDRKPLGAISIKFSDGPFGSNLKSEHYTEQGIRIFRLQNVGVNELVDKDKAYISEAHFSSLQKHRCIPGDVIIGTLGDPNLRAFIQPKWIDTALNKADCVQLRPDPRKCTAEYVCAMLNQPSTLAAASHLLHGQTRVRISMGTLRQLELPVPPLDLQQVFARLYREQEATKERLRQAIANEVTLFASLSQRAFHGDLLPDLVPA